MTDLCAKIHLAQGGFTLDVEIAAPAGGITVLFGPSGAGKSSLLAALAGLKRPDAGRISLGTRVLDDRDTHLPPHRRGIGLVFQDARLFPHLSVRGNIAYGHRRAPPRTRPALEDVAAFFDIAGQLDRPVANLSGGEKSRVALARAVASAPDFLLLDEPFAALDGARRRAFVRVLLDMHKRFALPMLVVTHDMDDAAALGSHLIGLKDGRVAASGDFAATAATPAFRAVLDRHDHGSAVAAAQLWPSPQTGGIRNVWLRADHVLLAAEAPRAISARNVMAGTVAGIEAEEDGSLMVTLATDAGPILSRITQAALRELELVYGKTAWALVKAHAV
ncbi:MAG: ATP-binding cassette domain-containing protein [Alphaproteobacteria bacterium]|nr:ATP-binding cassette domain-containing protein [Alphaproteobacteria bacterium]